ncbi:unnamed protein product [Pleuronectes platessa]|uniref:Uncharacterized protein n=1 Tax=Pleuronectes platessa TaxID=8262 RepID=A0A9N7Z931_PLEPL|nr:unnamed protein product [Pleuronectes platessa]
MAEKVELANAFCSESWRELNNMLGTRAADWEVNYIIVILIKLAVSLNIPTCFGHSLSGNLQYHSEIKRSVEGGMMKRYNLADSAYGGRRIPLINPPLLP